jgi:hypothetical protein
MADNGATGDKKSAAGHDDTCGYCSKKGPWARECRKKKRNEEAQAHVAIGDEQEQSLLLAHDVTLNLPSTPAPVVVELER